MKAILASGLVNFELCPFSVHQYLHYGWVPEPQTMVRGVTKLSPGRLLVITVDPWRVEDHTYWQFESAPPVEGSPGELIRAELETITDQVIRSDVPVGIALSGGLDSSLIAALATKKYKGTMQAFAVGYSNRPRQDERHQAKELAEKLGMPFHEIEISTDEMVEFFPRLNYLRDDPIADIAGYGYYLLSKHARDQGCPVLLQGQGGDELFWGYPWTVRAVEYTMRKLNGENTSFVQAFFEHLPKGYSAVHAVQMLYLLGGMSFGWKKLRPPAGTPTNQLVFYDINDSYQIGEFGAQRTYTKSFAEEIKQFSAASFFQIDRPWERVDILIMRLLCYSYLLQNGIAQGDRLSMANSVELRLPLVDHKLVELVVGLQKTQPSFNLPGKAWLKEAVLDILPEEILNRPKRGFNPPVTQWVEALRRRYGHELNNGQLVNDRILDPAMARKLSQSASRFGPWNGLFFNYIALEFWVRSMSRQATE
jgi:asparagine synthase (glutamine-hydrolysing)